LVALAPTLPDYRPSDWKALIQDARFVTVRGETQHPTDSGYAFARVARDFLAVPQEKILDAPVAVARLALGDHFPIIFLDDFVGSGQQFLYTWETPWETETGRTSFDLVTPADLPVFYCPVVATTHGLREIVRRAGQVRTFPGHELGPRYNVFDPESLIWPEDLRPTAEEFVHDASMRAGIPDTDGGADDWRGFHKLGLALAFGHGVPDATLPLFWWESETWNPLKRRPHE
jgi:hypothetical protein